MADIDHIPPVELPVTIGMLVEALSLLPKDALVCQSRWNGVFYLDRTDEVSQVGLIHVYEKDGDVKLIFDDGEAYHEYEKYSSSVFLSGGAMARATRGKA